MANKILLVIEASDEVKAALAMALAEVPDARVEIVEVPAPEPFLITDEFSQVALRLIEWMRPWQEEAEHRPYPNHLKQPGWAFRERRR